MTDTDDIWYSISGGPCEFECCVCLPPEATDDAARIQWPSLDHAFLFMLVDPNDRPLFNELSISFRSSDFDLAEAVNSAFDHFNAHGLGYAFFAVDNTLQDMRRLLTDDALEGVYAYMTPHGKRPIELSRTARKQAS